MHARGKCSFASADDRSAHLPCLSCMWAGCTSQRKCLTWMEYCSKQEPHAWNVDYTSSIGDPIIIVPMLPPSMPLPSLRIQRQPAPDKLLAALPG
jgi:hypothetical protein